MYLLSSLCRFSKTLITPFISSFIIAFILISSIACTTTSSHNPSNSLNIPNVEIDMVLKQVSDHVYYVQGAAGIATDNKGFISNAAVIITDEGILIFDALGTPSLAKKLVFEIRKISNKPIKKIIISHYHADHIFGLQGLPLSTAKIIAPSGAQAYLDRDGAEIRLNERRNSLKPWVNETTQLTPANQYVSDDVQFTFGGLDIQILHFGSAHSDGDLSLFVKQDKVLMTGDLLFTGRIPFIGGDNIQQWINKIDLLATLPAKIIIPGHGAAFSDFSKGSILTKSYLQFLLTIMTNGVDELMSFDEIYSQSDWSEFSNLPAFKNGNRLNAYRVFLNAEKTALDNQ